MGRLFQTALAESVGGAAAGIVADSVLYAVDSAKVRAQTKSAASISGQNISILFRGLVPTVLMGSVPVFGIFFFIYAPVRVTLQEQGYDWLLPLASVICSVPATIIGVPSDVLKKRLVLGVDPNIRTAIAHITADQGWRGLFTGWHVNLVRDLPFAGIKIGLYESFACQWKSYHHHPSDQPITTTGAALCGVTSGIVCAVVTCPLDVVNTRIKSGAIDSASIVRVGAKICEREGPSALFRGVLMRSFVLGAGSSIFWPIQRSLSHALQSYDTCPF